MRAAIGRTAREERRRVWLVGLAKRSAVLDQFRLAMSLAGIFDRGSPCFVKVPAAMQESVYRWDEYLRGPEESGRGGELPKFNLGDMHFVRFGARPGDPVWTADVFAWQVNDAQAIFGHLLADARWPVSRCRSTRTASSRPVSPAAGWSFTRTWCCLIATTSGPS